MDHDQVLVAPSTLDPAGPVAGTLADLYWWMFWAGSAVYVGVLVLLLVALRRASRSREPRESRLARPFVLWLGIAMPVAVLVPVSVGTLAVGAALESPPETDPLRVDVVGHQFWWEVRYPDLGVVTANEIHVPVDRPVTFRMLSDDVIHSFWVPQVGGKLDMIPGRDNSYTLTADRPGTYQGICAEFCGIQHARMLFLLVAQPEAEFDAWVADSRAAAPTPVGDVREAGLEVFRSACAQCHRVAGVSEAVAGPDLTRLADRRTLAAGVLENNRGNLGGWIMDPQSLKPGNLMPPSDLTGPELQALLAYLETLE